MADQVKPARRNVNHALIAGGIAGTAVDTVLFPLDTIKTRLQSQQGFKAAGGFRAVYSGLGSAVLGSAPNAALFFTTYEITKHHLSPLLPDYPPITHMLSASLGEIAACTIRVPTDLLKQRLQTNLDPTLLSSLRSLLASSGPYGLYRGFFSTVAREIPFTCLQFPIYEWLKTIWGRRKGGAVDPWEAALCGSVAGGLAGGLTTPLDVAKTRIMLSGKGQTAALYSGTFLTLKRIWVEEGLRGLFAGVGPRVVWISIGGSIFLGVYEKAIKTLSQRTGDEGIF